MMRVHRSGYYAWLKRPKSARQLEDERLLGLIKPFWLESGGVYGYRKIYLDLRSVGEVCGINKVARLMNQAGIKAQVGYKRPRHKSGKPAALAENHLKQEFDVDAPNQAWVTDITYIRTFEGWPYVSLIDCMIHDFPLWDGFVEELLVQNTIIGEIDGENFKADTVVWDNVTLDGKVDLTNAHINDFRPTCIKRGPKLNLMTTGSNIKF